ncbi:hypothetical protein [Nostoc sp.]|uniref:hypothetical protein n=1 Tax=Nostoc sp. TaxID=1180 RepID=UPI002FFC1EA1
MDFGFWILDLAIAASDADLFVSVFGAESFTNVQIAPSSALSLLIMQQRLYTIF